MPSGKVLVFGAAVCGVPQGCDSTVLLTPNDITSIISLQTNKAGMQIWVATCKQVALCVDRNCEEQHT